MNRDTQEAYEAAVRDKIIELAGEGHVAWEYVGKGGVIGTNYSFSFRERKFNVGSVYFLTVRCDGSLLVETNITREQYEKLMALAEERVASRRREQVNRLLEM